MKPWFQCALTHWMSGFIAFGAWPFAPAAY